uniref:Putative secreted protein n=1 Tax=Anopheles darlingi TaxID=43151 RepID=A0A2M4D1S7_ANODA
MLMAAAVSSLSVSSSLHRSLAAGCLLLVQDIWGPFGVLLSAIDASITAPEASISLWRLSAVGWPAATLANTCGGPSSSFFVLNRRMMIAVCACVLRLLLI